MKPEEVIIIVDEIGDIDQDKLQILKGLNNNSYTFSKVLKNIDTIDICRYLLIISNFNQLDINEIKKFKEMINYDKEPLIVHFNTQVNQPTFNDVLSQVENINMCLIDKELAFKIQGHNNLRANIDLFYTEALLMSSSVKIVKNESTVSNNCVRKCSIDTDIKKTLQLIKLYEENSCYIYHDLRYTKDIRRIIDKLKLLTYDRQKVINYVKMLQPLAKEALNLSNYKFNLIEEIFIEQVNNGEFDATIKTLKYLNKEKVNSREELEESKIENERYRLKCEEILTSKSWCITKPLRVPKIFIKKVKKKFKNN